jgi:two-component system phosphate regulon sensor histidine kinase PhoR
MTRRAIELLILVLLGSVWGLAQDSAGWTLAGALLGGVIWSVFHGLRVYRLLHWLNKPDTDELPRVSGLWAEVLDRSRKLIRKLEKKASNADARAHALREARLDFTPPGHPRPRTQRYCLCVESS